MMSQCESEVHASMQRLGVSTGLCDHSCRLYSRRRGHKSKLYAVPPIFAPTPICDDSGRALRLPEGVMSCMAAYTNPQNARPMTVHWRWAMDMIFHG